MVRGVAQKPKSSIAQALQFDLDALLVSGYIRRMTETLKAIFNRSAEVKSKIANDAQLLRSVDMAAKKMLEVIRSGGTIYSCGNGGSTCDSMHLTEELIARFKRDRPGIKAMHFHDPGAITCWSNDYGYDTLFERYVKTFCGVNDCLVAISTSGNSPNILKAIHAARACGTFTIGLGGKDGGQMKDLCDIALIAPATETERIQECHITIIHAWCELIETALCDVAD